MRISDWSSDVCSSDLSIARMERHECLTGELVNRQAISIDDENSIGGHDVANAASCNDVHRTGRGDVEQPREAKTAQTLRTRQLARKAPCRKSLIDIGTSVKKIQINQ